MATKPPPRGLRHIRTLGSVRRSEPSSRRSSAPAASLDARFDVGSLERIPDAPPPASERPRAWVFVKRRRPVQRPEALLVERIVEPNVEVFEEGHAVVVLAELPGVEKKDIVVHVLGDVLTLATKPSPSPERRRYYRELLLPFPVSQRGIRWELRNAVLELELRRAAAPSSARRKIHEP